MLDASFSRFRFSGKSALIAGAIPDGGARRAILMSHSESKPNDTLRTARRKPGAALGCFFRERPLVG
jgi:hypothetical protein